MLKSADIFPVFDPITEDFLFYKPRDLVHTEGDWHRGVQANIIRKNDIGTFDILLQERSNLVDIAAHAFDQSLATQMIDKDNLDEDLALARGLRGELNIVDYSALKLDKKLRIVKTYEKQPTMHNRELISLYAVLVDKKLEIQAVSPKVERVFWMEWSDFLRFFQSKKLDFTKTAQFYFSNPTLLHGITAISYELLRETSEESIIHIDRVGAETRTYEGDVAKCLRESGELKD